MHVERRYAQWMLRVGRPSALDALCACWYVGCHGVYAKALGCALYLVLNTHSLMRNVLLLAFVCLLTVSSRANVSAGLKEAMDKGMVKVAATATGKSYHGKGMSLVVSNTTKERLQVKVEPALIFKPDEDGYQHLVLPAEEMLALAPGSSTTIEVQTFCGKLAAKAPMGKLTYKLWRQGDSNLIKVTQFIKKHELYDELGQQAVWAITDKNGLDGVIDMNRPKATQDLQALLAVLTRQPIPEVFKLYRLDTTAGAPVFRMRVLKIITKLEWQLQDKAAISLGIYNRTGDLVQGIMDSKPMTRGKFKMMVQFEAENAPPGNYYLRLFKDEKLWQEKVVTVE